MRVSSDNGWDARRTTGVSLSLRDIVVTTGHVRGERGLPNRSRWTLAAGFSF